MRMKGETTSSMAATAGLAALLLLGCARNPSEPDGTSDANDLPGTYDTSATGPLIAARTTHEEAQAGHRLSNLEAAGDSASAPGAKAATVKSLGARPGGRPAVSGARQAPDMAKALLKRAALAKGPAGLGPDTAGFRYGDSAKGYIQQVRTASLKDAIGDASVSDSLVYKWPYNPASPAVLFHAQRRAYAGGQASLLTVHDEDGDGILNEAGAGLPVKLRKEWTLRSGDSAWKSVSRSTHGQTTFYDSLGTGRISTWSDSAFLGGKATWWQRTYDGDGDGFALTGAAAAKPKIMRDAFALNPDGSIRLDYESFGPGPDLDFLKAADNERHPFRSVLISAAGKDLAETRFGDGDGDGLWWSPIAGAENRGWAATTYAADDSLLEYRDSVIQLVPADAKAAGRIVAFTAEARYRSGVSAAWSTRLPTSGGLSSFSGSDTVQLWERRTFAASAAASDLDSTVTVLWLIPGDPSDPADDSLTQWYAADHYKAGRPLIRSSHLVKSDHPFAAGAAPAAGTVVREDFHRPASGRAVARIVEQRGFGPGSDGLWKRTTWFENGDSAVASGRALAGGASAYAQALGRESRAAGWIDAKTGGFRDTLTLLDAKGQAAALVVSWGALDRKTGTGEFRRKRVPVSKGVAADPGDGAAARYAVSREGSGHGLVRIGAAGDTLRLVLSGDTASHRHEAGGRILLTRWHPHGAGAFRLVQTQGTASDASSLGSAEYLFGQDGAGAGVHRRPTPAGTKEGAVQFRADGSIYYDGVKVVTGR